MTSPTDENLMHNLREWARALKRDIKALWIAARDPRVSWVAKVIAGLVAGYALSPVDLIPDFIPVLGLVDDLLLVPAGIWLALRLVPAPLMEEFRDKADRWNISGGRFAFIGVIIVWIVLGVTTWWLWRY